MKKVLGLLGVTFFAMPALAEMVQAITPPEDLGGAATFLPAILAAVKNGQYLAAGALISLILTWVVKAYVLPKLNLGSGMLPLVAAITGLVGGVGLAVANGGTLGAAALAVLSGPLAGSLWEAIMQYFVPAKPAPAAVPPAPPAA